MTDEIAGVGIETLAFLVDAIEEVKDVETNKHKK